MIHRRQRSGTVANLLIVATCLFVATMVPYKEVSFVLAAGIIVVLRPFSAASLGWALGRIWPILLMTILAVIATGIDVAGEYESYAFARIAFYYVRIPIFFLLGIGARRYLVDQRTILWLIIAFGSFTVSQVLYGYVTASNLSGLDHHQLRTIVGSGDIVSLAIPLCVRRLWRRGLSLYQYLVLLAAFLASIAGVIVTDSRAGQLIVLVGLIFTLPRVAPLSLARLMIPVIYLAAFVVTTPVLTSLLAFFSVDVSTLPGINEVIAAPRYDMGAINEAWRGYETYMAFSAAQRDGFLSLMFGHGMSASADLGIFIELAPDQFFNRIDEFHNGFSFITLHSGLVGVLLYGLQFWVLTKRQKDVRSRPGEPQADASLFCLMLVAAVATTPVVAGIFNQGSYASYVLFLLGLLLPFTPLRSPRPRQGTVVVPRYGQRVMS